MSCAQFFRQFEATFDFSGRAGHSLTAHLLERFDELALSLKGGITDFLFGVADLFLRCLCGPVEVVAAILLHGHKWLLLSPGTPLRIARLAARRSPGHKPSRKCRRNTRLPGHKPGHN